MRTMVSRVVAQRATHWQQDFVALWSSAMWILAAIYLASRLAH